MSNYSIPPPHPPKKKWKNEKNKKTKNKISMTEYWGHDLIILNGSYGPGHK